MQVRILLLVCFVSFLFCYLGWGEGQGGYFWELEYEIIAKGLRKDLLHPALLLPFVGQMLILIAIVAPGVPKWICLIGLALCGLLVLFLLFIEIIGRQPAGIGATVLYLIAWSMVVVRRKRYWPNRKN